MKVAARIFVLVAFLFSSGGHWYVLQGIAWVQMIHSFNQYYPLEESVSMTLSGKYPCAVCKAIAQQKQDENLRLVSLDKVKKLFVLDRPRETPFSQLNTFLLFPARPVVPKLISVDHEPTTPPPQFAV